MNTPLPPTETLHGHISQLGTRPGPERLAVFQKALALRGTPPLYAQENAPQQIAHVKFFDPCGSWTWYATEWNGKRLCFGRVEGHENEWGYFDIQQLASVRGRMGIGIEVDESFKPQPVIERPRELSKSKARNLEMEPGD